MPPLWGGEGEMMELRFGQSYDFVQERCGRVTIGYSLLWKGKEKKKEKNVLVE